MAIVYDEERSEILDFLPSGSRAVLDVGCSTGGFGRGLRSRGVSTLVGVEPNKDAAAIAAATYDHVLVGRFPHDDMGLPSGQRYDAIFFNDVLEHMPEPWLALRAARPLLKPGGTVICSIPNIKHISVLAPLILRDEFRYRESGILDATHVRFFTGNSIRRLMVDEGWQVETMKGINRVLRVAERRRRPWIGVLGKLSGGRSDSFFFVQYVVVLRDTGISTQPN